MDSRRRSNHQQLYKKKNGDRWQDPRGEEIVFQRKEKKKAVNRKKKEKRKEVILKPIQNLLYSVSVPWII